MASNLGTLTLDLIAKIGGFTGPMDKVDRRVKRSGRNIKNYSKTSSAALKSLSLAFAGVATVGAGAITALGLKSIQLASDLEEAQSKFNVVFRGMASEAEKFSEDLQDNFFMSELASKKFLSSIQDTLVPMGVARQEAGNLSYEIVKLAADLGSFNNLPTEQVIRDLQSALVGNTETVKKYGVVLKATDIQQRALIESGKVNVKELTNAEKVMAAYKIILEGSKDALGDMARTSGSYANQQKKFNASIQDLTTNLGEKLLPVATELITELNKWIDTNEELISQEVGEFIQEIVEHKDSIKNFANVTVTGFRAVATTMISVAAAFDLAASAIGNYGAVVYSAVEGIDIKKALIGPLAGFKIEGVKGTLKNYFESIPPVYIAKKIKENVTVAKTALDQSNQDMADKAQRYTDILKKIWESNFDIDFDDENVVIKQTKEGVEDIKNAAEDLRDVETDITFNLADEAGKLKRKMELEQEGIELTKEMRTAIEVYADEMERLNELLEIGAINQETYARAQQALADQGFEDAPKFNESGDFDQFSALEEKSAELERWYQEQLDLLEQYRQSRAGMESVWDEREQQIAEQHAHELAKIETARTKLMLSSASSAFGEMASLVGALAGEESETYKAMFAASKAFAIAEATLNMFQAISQAGTLPFPANLAAMAVVAGQMATIVSSITSVGMAHDGIDSVPQSGSWLLEKGERVTTANTSKKLDKTLDRIQNDQQSGGSGDTSINIYEAPGTSAQVMKRDDGSIDVQIELIEERLTQRMQRGSGIANYMDRRYGRKY